MSDCRGRSGTCCTGVGSDPCVCPDPEEELEEELDADDRAAMSRLARRALGLG